MSLATEPYAGMRVQHEYSAPRRVTAVIPRRSVEFVREFPHNGRQSKPKKIKYRAWMAYCSKPGTSQLDDQR